MAGPPHGASYLAVHPTDVFSAPGFSFFPLSLLGLNKKCLLPYFPHIMCNFLPKFFREI